MRLKSVVLLVVGGVCTFLLAFAGTLFVVDHFGNSGGTGPVSCAGKDSMPLPKPYTRESGYLFFVHLADLAPLGDTPESPTRSPFILCENGRPLGPAHTKFEDVRAFGQGRYAHWGGVLIFSASDNSDPNSNNRTYELRRQ
jgi:pectate lyase